MVTENIGKNCTGDFANLGFYPVRLIFASETHRPIGLSPISFYKFLRSIALKPFIFSPIKYFIMTICDSLEAYLKKEGFCPEKTDFGLQFKYETLDFVHFKDDDDELFLNLFFPQIFEVTEKNRADVLAALNRANMETKVVKGVIRFENAVWAGVEILLPEKFDLGDIVPRSLNMMVYYRDTFYRAYAQTPSGQAEIKSAPSQQGQA